jgi:hypothetical protein
VTSLFNPGANPTIASYNASAVKIYNAKSSLVRLEKIFSSTVKNALVYYLGTMLALLPKNKIKIVGLAPGQF